MKTTGIKTLLYWIGSVASLISVFFVSAQILEYGEHISISKLQAQQWIVIFCLFVGYGLSNLLLVCSWRELLRHLDLTISLQLASRIYGISQLAKYLPGNIFHLAGRQAIGVAEGLPFRPLAATVFWEIVTISVTAVPFAIVALPLLLPDLQALPAIIAFMVVITMLAMMAHHVFGRHIAKAVGWYALFLTVSGLVFYVGLVVVLSDMQPVFASLPLVVCGAYVVAWLAGLLTLGAPAGIGIREVVLYALLQGVITKSDLLAAIFLGRLVTATGDIAFFLFAIGLKFRRT